MPFLAEVRGLYEARPVETRARRPGATSPWRCGLPGVRDCGHGGLQYALTGPVTAGSTADAPADAPAEALAGAPARAWRLARPWRRSKTPPARQSMRGMFYFYRLELFSSLCSLLWPSRCRLTFVHLFRFSPSLCFVLHSFVALIP